MDGDRILEVLSSVDSIVRRAAPADAWLQADWDELRATTEKFVMDQKRKSRLAQPSQPCNN